MSFSNVFSLFLQEQWMVFFLPVFLLALGLQWKKRNKHEFDYADTTASLWMMLYVAVIDIVPKLFAIILFMYLATISPLQNIVQRQWWAWLLLFLLDDFIYYWFVIPPKNNSVFK